MFGFRAAIAMVFVVAALGQNSSPVRWQAQYTQIYADGIETVQPSVGPAFALGPAGSLTSNPAEVISGKESIKGSYFGAGSFTPYLSTNLASLPLTPGRTYQLKFLYRILTAPNRAFEVLFLSSTAAAAGNFLPSINLSGPAGTSGTGTLTNTLGPYTDYQALWTVQGTGAIAIDEIQLIDVGTGKVLASENGEATLPSVGSGLQLQHGATVVTDPSLVISGSASLLLTKYGTVSTNPQVVQLTPNTTYIVEFQYRIINVGTNSLGSVLSCSFQPLGTTDPTLFADAPGLLKNAAASGTFSTGLLTGTATSYVLSLAASADSSVIIDNLSFLRQDAIQTASTPAAWDKLASLPFPHLGAWWPSTQYGAVVGGTTGVPPFSYSVDQIDQRLAFLDVLAGDQIWAQSSDPASIRRLRLLNPALVILPYRISEEQIVTTPPYGSAVDLTYNFFDGIADPWYARDTDGNYVQETPGPWALTRPMNISDFAPLVNGFTFTTYLQNWLVNSVFPSGLWDGVAFDNLFDRINSWIPNFNNAALLDYDWNRNGLRDETPASSSEMTRNAAGQFLNGLRKAVGNSQIIMGNAGGWPELAFAPYVNGYKIEAWNGDWDYAFLNGKSEGGWRLAQYHYQFMQENSRAPHVVIVEAYGGDQYTTLPPKTQFMTPTAADVQTNRFTLSSALLGDGFYEYALKQGDTVPVWFDEFSVDATGVAVEDPANKGYLGHPLSSATELAAPGTLLYKQDFESGSIPSSLSLNPASSVLVSDNPSDLISGSFSLVLNNPDHTKQASVGVSTNSAAVPLVPGTYLLTFDWRIIETLDGNFSAQITGSSKDLDFYPMTGVVTGDSGSAQFPFTVTASGNWSISFSMINGGGRVAIDNIRLYNGGVGPWRRDFENGFALVNPYTVPHMFSAADLAGTLNRTGIHTIKGTQAPDINNGQPVTGDLTLAPFDAIILLADRVPVGAPAITNVDTPGGFPDIAQNGWIEIKGVNLAPPGVGTSGMIWSNALDFTVGKMPAQLSGVSVTVNGKPAFVYYVSPTQVNVLTPLDSTLGPVQIVVTSGGVSSPPFTVNMRAAAPSFPLVGQYLVATHADYSLVGPTSLSSPGYPFTPARPGETIVLYGFGFGLPTTALVNGSSSQSGPLPALPAIQIGGLPATVTFAAVVSPGLYQLNVMVPSAAQNGDNVVTCSYGGSTSPAGDLIAVQR